MAIGSLIEEMGPEFVRYMANFELFLNQALQAYHERQLFAVSVGVVSDLSRAFSENFSLYADGYMNLLLHGLQSEILDRTTKPKIISTFADIALALGPMFDKYLQVVMAVLSQAEQLQPLDDSLEEVEYVDQLYSSILETYTCIVQGLKDSAEARQHLIPFGEGLVRFVQKVSPSAEYNDYLARTSISLLG